MIISAFDSDKGIKKFVNQDALIIKKAMTNIGEIVFACICDGMGGLAHGELASSEVIKEINEWFEKDLSNSSRDELDDQTLVTTLNKRILDVDYKIRRYGDENGACGTTISGILLFNGKYLTINVGDSRVYKIKDNQITQLTHDHSYVQSLVDKGYISKDEARKHPQQNVLLQCIGTGEDVVADYTFGEYQTNDIFLICSDGFRHRISDEEYLKVFNSDAINNKKDLDERVKYCVELNMKRKEKDNISAIALKIINEESR